MALQQDCYPIRHKTTPIRQVLSLDKFLPKNWSHDPFIPEEPTRQNPRRSNPTRHIQGLPSVSLAVFC